MYNISVIITTYKRPVEILKRAIDSVLVQTYSNFELIIVDDTPEGDCIRYEIEEYINSICDNRIRYIKHQYNRGACEARNTGIISSIGQYIAFLDDDDEWMPNKLELQMQKFDDNEVGLVYCQSYTKKLDKYGNTISKKLRSHKISGWVYDKLILDNFIGSTSFVMLKRDALIECGYFNNKMKSAQDVELWLRVSKKYKVDFVDLPLVNYYVHEGERISSNLNNKIEGLEYLNLLNESYLKLNKKARAVRKLKIVPYYTMRDGWNVGLKKWIEGVIIYPLNKYSIISIIMILKNYI